ncbi:MAG TPA: redoxin domain-containing protein [Chitinophagaceae bacterium]|nr:redoxin domain-containing protein [Chitinophagaceae bacterium]
MRFFLIISFSSVSIASAAQKKFYATFQLIYPMGLTYDTLLVKNSESKVLSETSKLTRGGKMVNTYLVNMDSSTQSSFSIYFGGSLLKVNDTLYFIGYRRHMIVEIGDSFALGDRIKFKLRNVYNFEELYERYTKYCDIQRQRYYTLIKSITDYRLSEQQYSLKAKLDFVKKNISNPYTIDLFSFFVIAPTSNAKYNEIYSFYIKNLKNNIKDSKIRILVEGKIEVLKQSLDEGNKAPAFSAFSIHNELINSDTLLGKNILVIFWATWCRPCIKELPDLKQINEEYKKDNLVIVAISLDTNSIKMANMVSEKSLNWMHIFNNRHIIESYRINPIPAIFLIDEKGVILYNSINRKSETDDLNVLKLMLKQTFKH